jgi:uncharacterized repeat protein (TIGR04042 family)
MPAMYYTIRWPDASESQCYSPSLIIKDYFGVGERYQLNDFLERLRTATGIASDRVRAKYGYACSAALDQLQQVEQRAARFDPVADPIQIVAFNEGVGS